MSFYSGVEIGRILGIPIRLHPSWLLVFALIFWSLGAGYFPSAHPGLAGSTCWVMALVATLLFFTSILLHEMAHALVAIRNGIGIRSITLFVFGGVSQLASDPEDSRTEVWMALAGPLVSLLLAAGFGVLALFGPLGEAATGVAAYLAWVNLGLGLFNLVPAFPLDGGRILRGMLWRRQGKLRATRAAAHAGTLFAAALMVLGVFTVLNGQGLAGVWYLLIGWFLSTASSEALSRSRFDHVLEGVTVGDCMLRDVATIPARISVAEAAHDYFLHTGYSGYPVVRGEQVVGLLSLRDVLSLPVAERQDTSVQAVMTPLSEAIVVRAGDPLLNAAAKLGALGAGRLLVMEDGRLLGLITLNSVVRHVRTREALLS